MTSQGSASLRTATTTGTRMVLLIGRIDGFVSLGVVASAIVVSLGAPLGDPIIGLVITLVILKITCDACRTVSTTDPDR
jgi:divalent metal cation (Fe/Co/Zn/Cd) transporter